MAAMKYVLGGLALSGLAVAGYFTFLADQSTEGTASTNSVTELTEQATSTTPTNQCEEFRRFAADNGIELRGKDDFTVLEKDEDGRALVVRFKHEVYEDPHGHHAGYDTSTITFGKKWIVRSLEGHEYPWGTMSVWTEEEKRAAQQADCLFNGDHPMLPAGFHLR